MHFVTQAFLDSLPAEGSAGSPVVTDVVADADAPVLDIEVLSELRLRAAADGGDAVREFGDRYRRLRRRFEAHGGAGPAQLAVVCGGLLAPADSERGDEDGRGVGRRRGAYATIGLPALAVLSGDDAGPFPRLLTVPGDDDAATAPARDGGWPTADDGAAASRQPYYTDLVAPWVDGPVPERPAAHPVTTVFRVRPAPSDAEPADAIPAEPLAYVAVIGFDSNAIAYDHPFARDRGQIEPEQLRWSSALVRALRSGCARTAPLYVLVVTHHDLLPTADRLVHPPQGPGDGHVRRLEEQLRASRADGCCHPVASACVTHCLVAESAAGGTTNASGVLDHCRGLRTSLVLCGGGTQRSTKTVVTTPLAPGEAASELTVLAAPRFAPDRADAGMTRIRLDLWRGEARIAVQYDQDDGTRTAPVQVTRPLVSASRIGPGERRLYGRIGGLVSAALSRLERDPSAGDRAAIVGYAEHVARMWRDDGYAAVSMPDGTLPALAPPVRRNRYYLMLLLRESGTGDYELLLSRHNPLRPSAVAEWEALLMPAFSSVRDLMSRMRLDVVRQVVTHAEDLERAEDARRFEAAVDRIEQAGGNVQDDIWQDRLRELDTVTMIKISPTTGEVTEYEYRLVVLTPLVRDNSVPDPAAVTPEAQAAREDEERMVTWFDELPSLRRVGDRRTGPGDHPVEAVFSGGGGLRWDPEDPAGRGGILAGENTRRLTMPPGSVWFPVAQDGEEPVWARVPSIVARNADVMTWVDTALQRRRRSDGTFPPHVVMGGMRPDARYTLVGGPYPFDAAEGERSTRRAMDDVEYLAAFDLGGRAPYRDLDQRRVVLARRPLTMPTRRTRDVIAVLDATGADDAAGLAAFADVDVATDPRLLGLLRPAQRYVLAAGLERAEWVNTFLTAELDDPWGYLTATFGGAGEPVALTPPIIERVHADDVDGDGSRYEFLVCDGNHRVVDRVWRRGRLAPAVAVLSEPREPYYARPFSPYEWDVTADNVLTVTPPPVFRYAPRRVDPDALGLSDEAVERLAQHAREQWYRRYFRDLSRGFGPMGGQGGRYV